MLCFKLSECWKSREKKKSETFGVTQPLCSDHHYIDRWLWMNSSRKNSRPTVGRLWVKCQLSAVCRPSVAQLAADWSKEGGVIGASFRRSHWHPWRRKPDHNDVTKHDKLIYLGIHYIEADTSKWHWHNACWIIGECWSIKKKYIHSDKRWTRIL